MFTPNPINLNVISFDIQDSTIYSRLNPGADWIKYDPLVIEELRKLLTSGAQTLIYFTYNMRNYIKSKMHDDGIPKEIYGSTVISNELQLWTDLNWVPLTYGTPVLMNATDHFNLLESLSQYFTEDSELLRIMILNGFPELYTFKALCQSPYLQYENVEIHKNAIIKKIRKREFNLFPVNLFKCKFFAARLAWIGRGGHIQDWKRLFAYYGETSDLDKELLAELFWAEEIPLNKDDAWFNIKING